MVCNVAAPVQTCVCSCSHPRDWKREKTEWMKCVGKDIGTLTALIQYEAWNAQTH